MIEVTRFETDDGMIFEDEVEAMEHELRMKVTDFGKHVTHYKYDKKSNTFYALDVDDLINGYSGDLLNIKDDEGVAIMEAISEYNGLLVPTVKGLYYFGDGDYKLIENEIAELIAYRDILLGNDENPDAPETVMLLDI